MQEQSAAYWAKFSHEWAFYVLSGTTICDDKCLATKRHLGAPVYATVEGATKWFNTEGPTKLKW